MNAILADVFALYLKTKNFHCFAVARPMPLLPPVTSAIFPLSLSKDSSPLYQNLSDCEDDPAEGAVLH